jgi:hypothetical protein
LDAFRINADGFCWLQREPGFAAKNRDTEASFRAGSVGGFVAGCIRILPGEQSIRIAASGDFKNEMIAGRSALCSPVAALGAWDIVVRLEIQPLPKAIAGKADQNNPADDHQTLQHGYWTSRVAVRFKS